MAEEGVISVRDFVFAEAVGANTMVKEYQGESIWSREKAGLLESHPGWLRIRMGSALRLNLR